MPARDPFTTSGAGPFVPDDWARRSTFRVRLDVPVAVSLFADGEILPRGTWNLHDLSGSGSALDSVHDELEAGAELLVRVDVAVADRPFTLSLRARVARVAPSPTRTRYGVEWVGLTDAQTDTLFRLALAVTRAQQRHVDDPPVR